VDRMEEVIDPRTRVPCYRSSLNVCERIHNKAFPEECQLCAGFGRRHDEPFHRLWRPASKNLHNAQFRTLANSAVQRRP
jgi:hypothetical protein